MASQMNMDFVQKLYTGYYGRAADPAGLEYWAQRADQEGQAAIVNAFGTSEEFQQEFGNLDNSALVNNLYQQLFSRDAEQQGLDYYVGLLDSGEKSLSQIALTIANAASGSDQRVLDTKLQAADYYTQNVSDDNYDASVGERILDQIDAQNTGADLDEARNIVDRNVAKDSASQNLEQLQQAQQQLQQTQAALDEKAQELNLTDADGDGSYRDDAVATVQQNMAALATARAETTDEELDQAVQDAQQAIQDNSQTAALQDNLQAAEAELQADVQSDGETAMLAGQLNDALALYLANNDDIQVAAGGTTLSDLQSAAKTYLQAIKNPDTEADAGQFLSTVDAAQESIFSGEPAEPGGEPTSVLMESEQASTIEQNVITLDERQPLVQAVSDAESALNQTTEGQALVAAKDAVDAREELIEAVDLAEANVEAISEPESQRDQAQNAVQQAENELDFELAEISSGSQDAGDDAYLFQFDADAESPVTSASIENFAADDLLAVLSENDYSQGTVNMIEQQDGSMMTTLDGDNGAFEFFVVGENGNTNVLVETLDYGSVNYGGADPQGLSTVTLTGVNADAVTAEGSTLSIA